MRLMKLAILIIVTSHSSMGDAPDAEKTGLWLEELSVPYQIFAAAGADITIASPLGGRAPIDPRSLKDASPEAKALLDDAVARAKIKATVPLAEVRGHFDAVFVAGGHGTMWDLPNAPAVAAAIEAIDRSGGVVAAVCHGPAALVGPTKADGAPLVAGKRVAAFSNDEERGAKLEKIVPFMLETRLVELGARYEHGPMWQSFVVVDGRLVTGQNPASSRGVAEAVVAALKAGAPVR